MSWRIFYAIIFKEIETRGIQETGCPFLTARRAHLLTTAPKWCGGGISYGKRALSEGKPFEKGLSENFYYSLRSAFLKELITK